MKKLFSILLAFVALLMLPVSVGATSPPQPIYHAEIEQDMATVLNELRSENGLDSLALRSQVSLPQRYLTHRNCIMNVQARRVFEQGGSITHDGSAECAQSGVGPYDYAAPTEVLALTGGNYNVSSTMMSLYNSMGHRVVLLSNADWVTIYSGCYFVDGVETQITYIGFGSDTQSPIIPSQPGGVPLDYTNFAPAANGSIAYHGCNQGSTTVAEPIIDSLSTDPAVRFPKTAWNEPSFKPATSETWYRFQVARLYSSYFERYPDVGGWVYWNNRYVDGMTLGRMSDYFADSTEFKATYGDAVSNIEFIELVYNNVLDRESDAGGKTYWLDRMNGGMTRGEIMIYFAESTEFINKAGPQITGPCWNGNSNASYTCAAYETPGL